MVICHILLLVCQYTDPGIIEKEPEIYGEQDLLNPVYNLILFFTNHSSYRMMNCTKLIYTSKHPLSYNYTANMYIYIGLDTVKHAIW